MSRPTAGAVIVILTLALALAAPAGADRRAHVRELQALKTLAMRRCNHFQPPGTGPCTWGGDRKVRISTVDARYAWVVVGGDIDNSGVWKRPARASQRWRQLAIVGGGIQPCEYWYREGVPRRVATDLHISGFRDGSQDFTYHLCK